MARVNVPILAFNRGLISPVALARADLQRMPLSASLMTNWLPKTQGAMRIRPGTKYLGSSVNDTGAAWIDFVAATDDTALLEITDGRMRVWIDDALLERAAIGTTFTGFTDTGVWKSDSEGPATMTFSSGLVLDAMARGGIAKATSKVTLGDTGDEDAEIALAIHVSRGPVTFRCGNDTGDDSFIRESSLGTGRHNLAFTPNDTGGFHLTFQSMYIGDRTIASIAISDTGTMELVAPWEAADLSKLRWDQSADVLFVAAEGYQQHRIERRGTGRSWSVVEYAPDNGPFYPGRTDDAVKLRVMGHFGNDTLEADRPFFRSGHVGSLFYLFHQGYEWRFDLAAEDTYTDPITVTGISQGRIDDRAYEYKVRGTWSGTLNLLHTTEDKDVGPYTVTTPGTAVAIGLTQQDITDTGTFAKNDTGENAINNNLVEYVKVGFLPGKYTSGTANIKFEENNTQEMGYDGGGDFGICRVLSVTSSTEASVEVLRQSPRPEWYTSDWREGMWSDAQLWPTDVALFEGRLWWFGRGFTWASVSDDYENFDDTIEGDAAPITREIGSGPVDNILFSAALGRLLLGMANGVLSLRSTAFDEPLTQSNLSAKPSTTQGTANIRPVRIDSRTSYVHRSLSRLYELFYNPDVNDYSARELTVLNPEVLQPGVVAIAVQRQPDTRLHCVLADGTVAILTYELDENVLCWSKWETDGAVERAVVLPGTTEDKVYYHIRRTINGQTRRYLEKWALESECQGDTGLSWIMDCAVSYTDTGRTATPSGFDHLEGEAIIGWSDDTGQTDAGKDQSPDVSGTQTTYTVSGGVPTLSEDVHHFVGGLPFTADYRSTKLAYGAQFGTALGQMKRSDKLAFILSQAHNNALFFGSDSGNLDPLPRVVDEGAAVDADKIFETFDQIAMPFPGLWDEDSRIYLRAKAPRPVTVMAVIPGVTTHEKT